MNEQRACKECGKLFTPKGREQYCPDIHYRPCPVCGKPVVAKYLSDPPRRCEDCKAKRKPAQEVPMHPLMLTKKVAEKVVVEPQAYAATDAVPSTPAVPTQLVKPTDSDRPGKKEEMVDITDELGMSTLQYVGTLQRNNYFQAGHVYLTKVFRTFYGYWIEAYFDATNDEEVDIARPYSSKVGILHDFKQIAS